MVKRFRIRSFSRHGIVAAVFFMLLQPGAAIGAEKGAAEDKAELELSTVVVTAQKREENVQDIPMSVSVVTEQKLEESGIKDTEELMRYIPNIFVRDAGNYFQTNIRGISNFSNSLTSPVGIFIDDVNIPNVFMQNINLFDIERVEVLKGPQGTLYGSNSEAGVINIVTKQPDNELRGKVITEYNAYDTDHGLSSGAKLGAAVSGPIVEDKLFIGLSGKWDYTNGFVDNVATDDDDVLSMNDFTGRGTLRWTPDSHWDVSFIMDGSHNDDGMGFGRYLDGPFETRRHTVTHNEDTRRLRRSDGQALRAKYSDDDIIFTSITGRRFFTDRYNIDIDLTAFPIVEGKYELDDQLLSQEFRLASAPGTGPLEWLAGVYAYRQDVNVDAEAGDRRTTDIENQGAAIFGQATYTFFDRLHLTGGARIEHVDMEGDQTRNSGGAVTNFSADSTDTVFLPKATIAYDVTDTVMTYATVARGYLAGGYDYNFPTSSDSLQYDPEYTMNYEVGVKTSWFANRLGVNVALFHIEIDDKQVSQYDAAAATTRIFNAAEAHTQGFEVEVQARPYEGWELFGGFGYTKTEIDSWSGESAPGVSFDRSGNELTYAPEYTYNVGVHYTHETGIFGRVEVLGTGPFFHDVDNELRENAYELVNVRLGYEDDTYMATLWCKNLFDTEYQNVEFVAPAGTAGFDGDPRQFGLTLGYKF